MQHHCEFHVFDPTFASSCHLRRHRCVRQGGKDLSLRATRVPATATFTAATTTSTAKEATSTAAATTSTTGAATSTAAATTSTTRVLKVTAATAEEIQGAYKGGR